MIDRLEILHVLVRDHHMNLSDIMEMPPWMLDVKLLFIQRDLDDQAERLKKQKNNIDMAM